jgi:hypothetical protein
MVWWGVAPFGAGSLVRGFYIDGRHVSVPGIDRYYKHARAMHARTHLSSIHLTSQNHSDQAGSPGHQIYATIVSRSPSPVCTTLHLRGGLTIQNNGKKKTEQRFISENKHLISQNIQVFVEGGANFACSFRVFAKCRRRLRERSESKTRF